MYVFPSGHINYAPVEMSGEKKDVQQSTTRLEIDNRFYNYLIFVFYTSFLRYASVETHPNLSEPTLSCFFTRDKLALALNSIYL